MPYGLIVPESVRTRQPQTRLVASNMTFAAARLVQAIVPVHGGALTLHGSPVFSGTTGRAYGLHGLYSTHIAGPNHIRALIPNAKIGRSTVRGGSVMGVIERPLSIGVDTGHLFGIGSDNGGAGNTLFSVQGSGGGSSRIDTIVGGSTNYAIVTDLVTLTGDNGAHVIISTIQHFGSNSVVSLYIDGILTQKTISGTVGANSTFNWLMHNGFRRGGVNTNGGDAMLALTAAFDGELTPAEARSLCANPWQIFEPDDTPVFYSLPSSGPILSFPGVTEIGQTSARPRVTLTY